MTAELLAQTSATEYHSLRSYLPVLQWMDKSKYTYITKCLWGMKVSVMKNTAPTPETLLKIIHCFCSGIFNTYHVNIVRMVCVSTRIKMQYHKIKGTFEMCKYEALVDIFVWS